MKKIACSIFMLFLLSNAQVATERAINSLSYESSNTFENSLKKESFADGYDSAEDEYEDFEVMDINECLKKHPLNTNSEPIPSSYKERMKSGLRNLFTVKNVKKAARFTWKATKMTTKFLWRATNFTVRAVYQISVFIYRGSSTVARTARGAYIGYMDEGITISVDDKQMKVKPGDRIYVC